MFSLQVQASRQYPVCHGNGDHKSKKPRQTSAGLGEWCQICNCMKKSCSDEDPEVQQGCGQIRTTQGVQQTNANKRDNILKIIQVASGERSKVVLQCYTLQNKSENVIAFSK